MKFLATLTTVLYAFALGVSAIPVENEPRDLLSPESQSLFPRAGDTKTANYLAVEKAYPSIAAGTTRYAFTLKWEQKDETVDAKLLKFQKELGFQHIGLMVGVATKTKTGGTTSRPVYAYDFTGKVFDLTGTGKVASDNFAYKTSAKQKLEYVKTTTKSDADIITHGKTWDAKTYEYKKGSEL